MGGGRGRAVPCSAVQCSAVQCSAVQCSAVQCSAVCRARLGRVDGSVSRAARGAAGQEHLQRARLLPVVPPSVFISYPPCVCQPPPPPCAPMQGTIRANDNVTCTACAGTLLMELGLLSALTGNPAYHERAHRAAAAIFRRRSALGLVGSSLATPNAAWLSQEATIGPLGDSFYEYLLKVGLGAPYAGSACLGCRHARNGGCRFMALALTQPPTSPPTARPFILALPHPPHPNAPPHPPRKAYLMFGGRAYLDMFVALYDAAMAHMSLPRPVGPRSASFLVDVNLHTGRMTKVWVSSLGAFWPGMQALAGGSTGGGTGGAVWGWGQGRALQQHKPMPALSRTLSCWQPAHPGFHSKSPTPPSRRALLLWLPGQEADGRNLHANFTAAWHTFGWLPELFGFDLRGVSAADSGYNLVRARGGDEGRGDGSTDTFNIPGSRPGNFKAWTSRPALYCGLVCPHGCPSACPLPPRIASPVTRDVTPAPGPGPAAAPTPGSAPSTLSQPSCCTQPRATPHTAPSPRRLPTP
jgi:hypothetical protein